jgi:hypothetical protein
MAACRIRRLPNTSRLRIAVLCDWPSVIHGVRTAVRTRKSPSFRQGNLNTVCAQRALMARGRDLGDGERSYFGPAAQ